MLSIIKDQWFRYVFKSKIKKVQALKVSPDVVLDWVRYVSLTKYVNTDVSEMLSVTVTTRNSCTELYLAASLTSKKLRDNSNHNRDINDSLTTKTLDSWFIDDKGRVVLLEPYLDSLTENIKSMATSLKKYKEVDDPDYEYHRIRTMDILIDYHCLLLAVYGLK
jgi:hypothetical protein